jgi:ABC-type lipoprotein export system ATPase subunit
MPSIANRLRRNRLGKNLVAVLMLSKYFDMGAWGTKLVDAIEICNLRNIKKLRFEIPNQGVWLLTAGNGAGKTSLLACLRRIDYPNAFQVHFPTSLVSPQLDNHSNGTVTYEIDGEKVEYAYRGERWTPRPRRNSHLFKKLGYPTVTYIGATAERITPRQEDFDTKGIRSVKPEIIAAANDIFDTQKFSELRSINLSRGVGNDAFVLNVSNSPKTYHSEKHFSLGELCVLKLLRLITQVSNNSMIIIDELEMALHPRAQVKLLRYLEEQARGKKLTIVFSTHSVTLLKTIDRKQIIYLEKQDDGEIRSIIGCYPTYALGNIAADEETLPDIVLYVEDAFARDIVTAFFTLFADKKYTDPTERPTLKTIPVGGFQQVVMFLDQNRAVLPGHVKQRAILDADVKDETLKTWNASKNHKQLAKVQKLSNKISYLPFTPEVGLISFIANDVGGFQTKLRQRFVDNQIHISSIMATYNATLQNKAQRDECKRVQNELLAYLEEKTQRSEETVREILCGVFAQASWATYKPNFMQLFGSLT